MSFSPIAEPEVAELVSGENPCRDLPVPRRVPKYGRALFEALRFQGPDATLLHSLSTADWQSLIGLCDPMQMTLTLHDLWGDAMPAWLRDRVEGNLVTNAERFRRLKELLFEMLDALEAAGIEAVVLKGLTHYPDFSPNPVLRAQSDIDLWVAPGAVEAARDVLTSIGFVPLLHSSSRHLPPMARRTSWRWTGDYYAVDLPIAVDLHYALWDARQMSIPAGDESQFWDRRTSFSSGGRSMGALCTEDRLAFAAMHLLTHLFGGEAKLHRAWELARFLHLRANDDAFWDNWREMHSDCSKRLQSVAFHLAARWFSTLLPTAVLEECALLPESTRCWLETLGWSPIEACFRPNRDEVWLHLSLIASPLAKSRLLAHRFLPFRKPGQMIPKNVGDDPYFGLRHRLKAFQIKTVRHFLSMPRTLYSGLGWLWRKQRFAPGFSRYLAVSIFFDVGAYIFVLLYNLLLLSRGFHEQFVGLVTSSMTVGTIAGTLPAAWFARRFGLRSSLLVAVIGSAAAMVFRATAPGAGASICAAAAHGVAFSFWAVSFAPSIAAFTSESNRSTAFSLTFAMGVGLGVMTGLLGGHMPGWLSSGGFVSGEAAARKGALLVAAAITAVAVFPLLRLKLRSEITEEKRIYPRSRIVWALLAVVALWSLASGAFLPFFNTYFSQRFQMSTERLGLVFSASQFFQAAAVFLTPALLKRFGQGLGIAIVQLAAACVMVMLAMRLSGTVAASLYAVYACLVYMCNPSIFAMLMSRVNPEQRVGTSALNFIAMSATGALASFLGGAVISHAGYPTLLIGSAIVAACAAVSTWWLLGANGKAPSPR